MPSETLPIDSPMLPPLVLRPPLGPRVLRGLVLALAAIFHVVTAGWSLIANGLEGDLAGAARELLRDHRWFPLGVDSNTAPLTVWLAKASMNLFGTHEFAARLPTGLAVVAAVWFTMRIGERFGGAWRGFVAGMVLLCLPGMFTVARTLSSAPLQAALVSAAFYFLVRGFEHRPCRRQWFFFFWIALALSYFAGGWRTVVVPAGTVLLGAAFFREARMRFPALLSWEGAGVVALTAGGAAACHFLGAEPQGWGAGLAGLPAMPWSRLLCWQGGLLFPWSILMVPAAWTVATRLFALRPLEWQEAFPLLWLGVGLTVALATPGSGLLDTVVLWPAFALWGAFRFEITPRSSFLRAVGGIFGLAAVGMVLTSRLPGVLAWAFPEKAAVIRGVPDFFWPSITSVAFIAVLAFALSTAAAFCLELSHRRRMVVLAFFGAMIPAGYAFADAAAKLGPYFSFADIAHCINGNRSAGARVVVDGSLMNASSLRFYLDPPLQPLALPLNPENQAALGLLWKEPRPAFLITRRTQLRDWRPVLDGRVRITCESGANLLLTNTSEKAGP